MLSVSVIKEVSHMTDDSGVFDYVIKRDEESGGAGHSSKRDLTRNKDLFAGIAALASVVAMPLGVDKGQSLDKRSKKTSVSSTGMTDLLYNRWRKQARQRQGDRQSNRVYYRTKRSMDREKSVIATLLVITLLFLIGTFPQAILRMVKTTQRTKDNPVFQIVRVLSNLSELLNASLNFYIYCLCKPVSYLPLLLYSYS